MHSKSLRCFAEKKGNQWQAFCVDLNLAVQGDSFPIVRDKLDAMVGSYIHLAFEQDSAQAREDMLNRPAPLSLRARYVMIFMENRIRQVLHDHHRYAAEIFSFRKPEYC
jgi:hypothetical protein